MIATFRRLPCFGTGESKADGRGISQRRHTVLGPRLAIPLLFIAKAWAARSKATDPATGAAEPAGYSAAPGRVRGAAKMAERVWLLRGIFWTAGAGCCGAFAGHRTALDLYLYLARFLARGFAGESVLAVAAQVAFTE